METLANYLNLLERALDLAVVRTVTNSHEAHLNRLEYEFNQEETAFNEEQAEINARQAAINQRDARYNHLIATATRRQQKDSSEHHKRSKAIRKFDAIQTDPNQHGEFPNLFQDNRAIRAILKKKNEIFERLSNLATEMREALNRSDSHGELCKILDAFQEQLRAANLGDDSKGAVDVVDNDLSQEGSHEVPHDTAALSYGEPLISFENDD